MEKSLSVCSPCARHDLAGFRIDHVAEAIYGNKSADNQSVAELNAGCADPTFHGFAARNFADRRAGSSANAAFLNWTSLRIHASSVTGIGVGAHLGIADIQM